MAGALAALRAIHPLRMGLNPPSTRIQVARTAGSPGQDTVVEIPSSSTVVYLGEVRCRGGAAVVACRGREEEGPSPMPAGQMWPTHALYTCRPPPAPQTFTATVALVSQAPTAVRDVAVKVELATERAGAAAPSVVGPAGRCRAACTPRCNVPPHPSIVACCCDWRGAPPPHLPPGARTQVLADNAGNPLGALPPGCCHEARVTYDVRELGTHTLACSTVFTDSQGERKYHVQFFRWQAANPLAVKTKLRALPFGRHPADGNTFLEVSFRRAGAGPMPRAHDASQQRSTTHAEGDGRGRRGHRLAPPPPSSRCASMAGGH